MAARLRATGKGWAVGIVAALALAAWIWVVIRPTTLVVGGWLACIVAATWIVARVARETFYGIDRTFNRRATEAVPPTLDPPASGEPEGPADPGGAPES